MLLLRNSKKSMKTTMGSTRRELERSKLGEELSFDTQGTLASIVGHLLMKMKMKGAQDPGLWITKCDQNGVNKIFTNFQLYSRL